MRESPYLVGLIGAGVTPSLTPALHMHEAAALGLTYVYRPIDLTLHGIDAAEIGDVLDWCERLGFDAVNVTHPCKQSVIPFLDRVEDTAATLGAVNTVLFTDEGRVGHNTDTSGFEEAFRSGMPDAALERVVQLGAGGAGTAVADALLRLGTRRLVIVDVDQDRAAALARDVAARHGADVRPCSPADIAALLSDADGLVHCTPTGMADHPGIPVPEELLAPPLWVADIVYRPLETELLRAARDAGCRVLDGGRMAVHQAVDAMELITGIRPDADRMTRHFHDLVTSDEALIREDTHR
ncbi:shikimate dehydrogenase [Microbacterium sp. NPDC089189]|uniref:shikimate dehydrogenase n=1 Tax=Microbacterium sp. NPDC089189 TaxID=3154972 RepID=UPI00341A8A5D